RATIEPGWHLYGLATPPPSRPTTIKLTGIDAQAIYQQEPKRAFDANFNIETQTYEGSAEFLLPSEIKSDAPPGATDITAEIKFNVCDATRCLPPTRRSAAARLTVDPKATAASVP